jgi:hypothetical protein
VWETGACGLLNSLDSGPINPEPERYASWSDATILPHSPLQSLSVILAFQLQDFGVEVGRGHFRAPSYIPIFDNCMHSRIEKFLFFIGFVVRRHSGAMASNRTVPIPAERATAEISLSKTLLLPLSARPIEALVAILCILLAVYTIDTVRTGLFHLQHFQGPWWSRYTRLWICKTLASGNSAQIFVDINKKYGSVARIGPNNLITDDPEFTRRILAARSHYTRGPWFDSIKINPHISNIVSERNPGKHNHLRYQMSAGYAGKDIPNLESTIDERIVDFVCRIEQDWLSTAKGTKSYDIARRIQYLTVDIITHLSFGKPLGFVEADTDKFNFLATIETQLPIVQHFSVILELNTWLSRAASIKWLNKIHTDKTGIGMIMGVRGPNTSDVLTPWYIWSC